MRRCFLLVLLLAPPDWALAKLWSDTDNPEYNIIGPLHKCPPNKRKVPDGMGGYKCVDKRYKRAASLSPTIPWASCQSDKVPVAVGKGRYMCAPKKHRTVSDRRKLNYGNRVRRGVFEKLLTNPNFTGYLHKCPSNKRKVPDGKGTYMCVPKKHKRYISDRRELNKGDRIRRHTFNSYPLPKCGPGKALMFQNGKATCWEKRIKTLLCPTCPVVNCPSDKRKVRYGGGGYKCVDKKQ